MARPRKAIEQRFGRFTYKVNEVSSSLVCYRRHWSQLGQTICHKHSFQAVGLI